MLHGVKLETDVIFPDFLSRYEFLTWETVYFIMIRQYSVPQLYYFVLRASGRLEERKFQNKILTLSSLFL